MNRITSNYREGRRVGDLGYSNLLLGEEVSKGSHFGAVYSAIEWFQHGLEEYLYEEGTSGLSAQSRRDLHVVDNEFLQWLGESLFALSSFCYRKGNSDPQYGLIIPEEAIEFIVERVTRLKMEEEGIIGGVAESEFIHLRGSLNKLRLQARDVERHYAGWFHGEPSVIRETHLHPEILPNILLYQKFLNRLSSYLYWLTRVALLRQGVSTQPWISRIPAWIRKAL